MTKKEMDLMIKNYYNGNKIEVMYECTTSNYSKMEKDIEYFKSKGFSVINSGIGRVIGFVAFDENMIKMKKILRSK